MRFKRFTSAMLAGVLMTFSMAGTAFAYTGETEPAESTASASETEAAKTAETKAEKPAENTSQEETPYKVTVDEDGNYAFTLGEYEWSFNPEKQTENEKIGTVTNVNSYLHLRTGAGMNYEIIGHLLPGAQVKVVGEDGDWYKVVIPEQSGYVHSDYLRVMEKTSEGGEVNEELLTFLLTMMFQSQQQVSEGHGLTPPGNLTLVDDIGPVKGAGQQFITLVSKNGNTFYMVIDRDDDGDENVHFMNLVDEADLFALLDEDAQTAYQEEHRTPVVTEPQQTEPEKETTPADPEPEKPAKKSNWAPLMLLAIFGIGGIGFAGYTLMNKKKKEQEAAKPDPDADYQDDDDEEYDIPEDDDYEEDETDAVDGEDDYPEAFSPDGEE